MRRNIAGQKTGAQVLATDGTAFTGAVTVYITKDAGTQAIGTVGGGACAHEGNGYHTYAPSQTETDADLVAFTFIGTGASPVTIQHDTGPHSILADPDTGLVEIYNIVNNLVGADATLAVSTLADIADKILGRAVEGGADGGRTVAEALKRVRNRVTLSGSAGDTSRTMTVYEDDDTTIAWTATVTLDTGGGHANNVNPA